MLTDQINSPRYVAFKFRDQIFCWSIEFETYNTNLATGRYLIWFGPNMSNYWVVGHLDFVYIKQDFAPSRPQKPLPIEIELNKIVQLWTHNSCNMSLQEFVSAVDNKSEV